MEPKSAPSIERIADPLSLCSDKGRSGAFIALLDSTKFTALADEQEEVGTVGSRISRAGWLETEPNYNYRPTLVRGYAGNHGLYEEYYRGEPIVADSVNGITEALVSGTWEVQPPEEIEEADQERVEEFCEWVNARLKKIVGGWSRFIEHAASCLIFGFSIFEVVWGRDGDKWYPHKLAFREPSTVDRWLMDERMDDLLGVQFNTGFTNGMTYVLPAQGPSITDYRVLLLSLNRRGNNFEGISPMRPALHWIKYKQLLSQIKAVAAEKYGCPIPVIQQIVTDALLATFGTLVDDGASDKLQDFWKSVRAYEAGLLEVPLGYNAAYLGPPGTMPDLQSQIDYCDELIARCYSNEGSMLGLRSSVGSYALGEVFQESSLTSAPYYARKIAEGLEQLIRLMAQQQGLDAALSCRLVFRMDSLGDQGRWIDDLTRVLPLVPQMPTPMLEAVLTKLGLPVNSYADVEEADQTDSQLPYKISNNLNSGVAVLTPEVIRSSHRILGLPEPSDEEIAAHIARMNAKLYGSDAQPAPQDEGTAPQGAPPQQEEE